MAGYGGGADPLQVGDTLAGYRVVERIGRGGMGDVYRAWDDRLKRPVAIKAARTAANFDEIARRRFLRETRVACRVNHPYVATVYDVIEENGQPYLIMEYIEGRQLGEVVADDRPDLAAISGYALEIAEALAAIHAEGIVHRDLKPANVMITRAGHIKVMDFGVALPERSGTLSSSDTEPTLTRVGHAVGTINYMSPEQVAGRSVDGRSDLFSLGIVLYEAITDEHPFLRESALATASAIVSDAPGSGSEPHTLTEAGPIRQVVMRLLEKDPDARYDSAESLVADLRAVVRGEPLPSFLIRPSKTGARRLRAIVTAAVAALALATAGALWWHGRQRPGGGAAPRPVIAVLPFEDRTGDLDGDLRAQMVTDLLAADLGESTVARTLSSRRVQDILVSAPSPRVRADEISRVRRAAKVNAIVAGTIYKDRDGFRTSLDFYPEGSDEPHPFQIAAIGTTSLVDLSAAKIRTLVAPSAGTTGGGSGTGVLTSQNEEARLLEQRARRALRQSRYGEAIAFLSDAVKLDPSYLSATTLLGESCDRAGYGRKAKDAAERAMRLADAPTTTASERLKLEARAAWAHVNDQLTKELEYRRALAERFPDDPDILTRLAGMLGRKSAGEALPLLERAAALDPDSPSIQLATAKGLIAAGNPDKAVAALDTAERTFKRIECPTGIGEVASARGDLEYDRNDFARADQAFALAARTFEGASLMGLDADATKCRADAQLMLGQLGSAESLYQAAAEKARQVGFWRVSISALYGLGSLRYVAGDLASAERTLRASIADARSVDNPALLYVPLVNLVSLLSTTGRAIESGALAGEAHQIASAVDDKDAALTAAVYVADSELQQGRIDAALRAYRQLTNEELALDPPDRGTAVALLGSAEALAAAGRVAAAQKSLEHAIAFFRKTGDQALLVNALMRRAELRALSARWTDAEHDLGEVQQIGRTEKEIAARDLPRLALTRARIARLRGDWGGARKALASGGPSLMASAEVVLAAPARVVACDIEIHSSTAELAERACRDAATYSPSMVTDRNEARALLAQALLKRGRADDAEKLAREVLADLDSAGTPILPARAAAILVSLPRKAKDHDEMLARGRDGVRRYVAGIDESSRSQLHSRADLRELESTLTMDAAQQGVR
jgi:tetratricopeptide (TPR) repeat protein/predicted Ser/Thr protein kinase